MTTLKRALATAAPAGIVASAEPADGRGSGSDAPPTVALVTLGCARNDVDSEELAARLDEGGFALV
jgi:ribosomal protein S12 methylthiotransferase